MKRLCGLLAALLLPQTPAWSAEPAVNIYRDAPRSYVGANLVYGTLEFDNAEEDFHPGAIMVRLGGMANDYFGMEARFGTGVGKTTFRESAGGTSTKVDFSVDYLGGVYFTARAPLLSLPLVGDFYTQGYLGLGAEQIKSETRVCNATSCRSDTERNDESDVSFGAALGVRPRADLSLGLEYMQYASKNGIEVSTLEAGIMYHF